MAKVLKRKVDRVCCTSDLRTKSLKMAMRLYAIMATVSADSVAWKSLIEKLFRPKSCLSSLILFSESARPLYSLQTSRAGSFKLVM